MDTIRHSLVLWSWVYSLMTIFLDLPSQNHEYIPRCLFSQYYLLKIMNIISHDYFLDVAFSRSWTYSPKTSLYCLVKIKNCIPPWLYYQKLPWRWTPSVTPPTSSSTSGSLPGEPNIGRSLYKVKNRPSSSQVLEEGSQVYKNLIPNAEIALQQWYFQEASIYFVITIIFLSTFFLYYILMYLISREPQEHWVARGVAALCQIDVSESD